ncbi:SIMPL domain-containing protein [Flavobacterium silvaticum]|uniref:SIMPL domain-containing protein n=1 Tax=Flavobacterium silvaticum TaxID=1852020 RepID=A0A972JFY5_9FLAO|nr:SIMPL domain-containing protein [Flavobacterium silvaticum]NMH28469.1 SIMPL domain-containing protein [Flavobacterium silvaticum]
MKKILLILTALLSIGHAIAQTQLTEKPKISAVGLGTVTAFPNAAQITINLKHLKPTLREAINENQKTADAVLKIIRNYVSDSTGIKTSLISTDKSTVWNDKLNKEVFLGFESSQKIIFTLNDLKRMQDFTEELLKTKFNKIGRISYFNTEAQEFNKKAQELAVLDAIETTKRLANTAGIRTGKILYMQSSASPNDSSNNRVDTYEFESYGKGMGGRGVSSSGDLIKYSVSVTTYTEIMD